MQEQWKCTDLHIWHTLDTRDRSRFLVSRLSHTLVLGVNCTVIFGAYYTRLSLVSHSYFWLSSAFVSGMFYAHLSETGNTVFTPCDYSITSPLVTKWQNVHCRDTMCIFFVKLDTLTKSFYPIKQCSLNKEVCDNSHLGKVITQC